MLNVPKTVRYTATLPELYIDELRHLASEHQIPSVNFGIREALDAYLKQRKSAQYDALMAEAGKDAGFIERTLACDSDFQYADSEVSGEW